MYKFKREKQISFTDFNQPQGMQMNTDGIKEVKSIVGCYHLHSRRTISIGHLILLTL